MRPSLAISDLTESAQQGSRQFRFSDIATAFDWSRACVRLSLGAEHPVVKTLEQGSHTFVTRNEMPDKLANWDHETGRIFLRRDLAGYPLLLAFSSAHEAAHAGDDRVHERIRLLKAARTVPDQREKVLLVRQAERLFIACERHAVGTENLIAARFRLPPGTAVDPGYVKDQLNAFDAFNLTRLYVQDLIECVMNCEEHIASLDPWIARISGSVSQQLLDQKVRLDAALSVVDGAMRNIRVVKVRAFSDCGPAFVTMSSVMEFFAAAPEFAFVPQAVRESWAAPFKGWCESIWRMHTGIAPRLAIIQLFERPE